ncbi:Histone H2B [Aphis craccivora]|uniref:Histone H2B n=1 Tax=Aphis craccivora TaxID=307492 RepID=A0A6G0Z2T9_APHCR|nr:Histone H2B [Aphis craccivora]
MYDNLLRTDTGGNAKGMSLTTLVAFSDDVALVATGHTSHILETVCNNTLDIVSECMRRAVL